MNEFPLHYYSEELALPELPVRCRVVRHLRADGVERKAAVIEFSRAITALGGADFIVLAKGDTTLSPQALAGAVGVWLLPLDRRATEEALDLSSGLQPVIDWGALTASAEHARDRQVR